MFASVLGSHLLAPPHDAFSSTHLKNSAITLVKTEEMRKQEVRSVMEEVSVTAGAWEHEESLQSSTAVLFREIESQREMSVPQDKTAKDKTEKIFEMTEEVDGKTKTPPVVISTEARKQDESITGEKDKKLQKTTTTEYEATSRKKVAEATTDVQISTEKVSVQKVELTAEKHEKSVKSKVMIKQKVSGKPEVTVSSELTPEPVKDISAKVIQQGAISQVKSESRETGKIFEDEANVLVVAESEQKRISTQKEIKGTRKRSNITFISMFNHKRAAFQFIIFMLINHYSRQFKL